MCVVVTHVATLRISFCCARSYTPTDILVYTYILKFSAVMYSRIRSRDTAVVVAAAAADDDDDKDVHHGRSEAVQVHIM